MKAVKGNKVYTIQETMKEQYQKDGYDILEEDGTFLAYGKGKTVSFEQYSKLKEEYQSLLQELEETKEKPEDKRGKHSKKEGE